MTKAKQPELSNCHKAPVKVVGGDEGTNHYECTKCGKACDLFTEPSTNKKQGSEKPDTNKKDKEKLVDQPKKGATLLEHAKREMDIAGINKKPEDKQFADGVLDLIKVLESQKYHSGSSFAITVEIFVRLANRMTLSKLTSKPEEWISVSKEFKRPLWQNLRDPSYFSENGGKTWFTMRGAPLPQKQPKKEGKIEKA